MRKFVVSILVCLLAVTVPATAAKKKTTTKKKATTASSTKKKLTKSCKPDIAHCPPEGCGDPTRVDPNLNVKKNFTPSNPATQVPVTTEPLEGMKALGNPTHFHRGDTREELEALGEGRKIAVVARLLIARDEPSGESCNCGLHSPEETDNHLVLVSDDTVEKFPLKGDTSKALLAVLHQREAESLTAEFTPRVRLDGHPNFLKVTMDPLIDEAAQRALLVRVTGMLMFDSQHFIETHLLRVNNWEIHPVLKMEFCKTGTDCTADSNTGWKSIDDL